MDALPDTNTLRSNGLIPDRLGYKADRSDFYFRPDPWVEGMIARVEDLLQSEISSGDPLTREIGRHMLFGYAKRLRPIFVLLSQHMFIDETLPVTVDCAAAAELIHCASLFHDDVIDQATIRKGKQAANSIWGNKSAVIAGDQFFVLAFKLLTKDRDFRIIELFVDMCRSLAEGVMEEIRHTRDLDLTEERHLEIITGKTANFYRMAATIGGHLGGAKPEQEKDLAGFGLNFGLAFQLSDDLLDLFSDPDATGKHKGSDIRSDIYTCSIIYALGENAEFVERFVPILRRGDITSEEVDEIADVLRSNGAMQYAQGLVRHHGKIALDHLDRLPPGKANDAFRDLLGKITNRDF